MTGDNFTKRRLAWLEAVTLDQNMTGSAIRVANIIVLRYLSRAKGCAWPSFDRLAHDLGAGRSSIIRALALLEGLGWLVIEHNGGRHATNRYALQMQKQCHPWHENSVIRDKETVSSVTPEPFESNPLNEPNEGHSSRNGAFLAKRHPKLSQSEIRCFQGKVLAIVDNGNVSCDTTFLRLTPLIANGADFDEERCLERAAQFMDGWESETNYRELHVFMQSELQLAKGKRPAEKKQTQGEHTHG
jgi:Helix-turn-helix domain